MMLKRIYEDSSLVQLFASINESVSFKGIAIRITGTNGGTAATLGDVGRIQYIKRGVTIIDAGFDALHALCNVLGGFPNNTSTTSSTLDFFLYIPRRFNDNNVELVIPSDDAQIKCTFNSNLNTRVASAGKVEVYLDLEEGTQRYDLAIRQYSESIAGASTKPVAYEQPNILMIGFGATVSAVFTTVGCNITQLTAQIGAQVADFSLGALTDNTQAQFNLEASWLLMGVPYFANGDINSRLSDNLRLGITTSGASTPETLLISALFDNDRLTMSRNAQISSLKSKLANKAAKRDMATVAVVQRAVGASLS